MAFFALTNASRIAMVLMVVGSWAALATLAAALMRPTYNAGLVTLRTASHSKRKARLSRVVATTWMYTIVFIMLVTSFIGMGILMQDSADFFGFQQHILSWEYVLHPKFVALLCTSGLAASATAVVRFRRSKVMNAAAFENSWQLAFAVFGCISAAGFGFMLLLEAARLGDGAQGPEMPSGGNVAKVLAVLIATRSLLAGFVQHGATARETEAFLNEYLREADVTGENRVKLVNFAYSLPRRLDVTLDSLRGRMLSKGFDAETASAASEELRSAMVRMRKSSAREPPARDRIEEVPTLARIVDKIRSSTGESVNEASRGAPGVMQGVSSVLEVLRA